MVQVKVGKLKVYQDVWIIQIAIGSAVDVDFEPDSAIDADEIKSLDARTRILCAGAHRGRLRDSSGFARGTVLFRYALSRFASSSSSR